VKIIIDANVIVADPRFASIAWEQLRSAISAGTVEVVLPEFAFLEAAAALKRSRDDSIMQIERAKKVWQRFGHSVIERTLKSLDSPSVTTDGELRDSLREIGVRIQKVPPFSHELIIRRATQRIRPFDDKGSGYRDTLIWFFVLDVFRREHATHEVVFVSADRRAFASATSTDIPSLHDHLLADVRALHREESSGAVSGEIRWFTNLSGVPIPGALERGPLDLSVFVDDEQIVDAVVEAIRDSAGFQVEPTGSPFVSGVEEVYLTSARDGQVVEATAWRYHEDSSVIRIEFSMDLNATFLGIGFLDNQSDITSDHTLVARGRVRIFGRLNFDVKRRVFGPVEVASSAPAPTP
jgi:rRNA-processing protein FCF1